MGLTHRAFGSGDVLLSHGLPPYYHRDRSVSLPCSEWERVAPLRYCHQKSAPEFSGAGFWCVICNPRFEIRGLSTNYVSRFNDSRSLFQKTPVLWHLHTGSFFRFSIHVLRFTSRISNSRLRFVLRSFVSSVGWNRGQRPRLQRNRKVNDQAEWVISTPELNMLPCFTRSLSTWWSTTTLQGDLILG